MASKLDRFKCLFRQYSGVDWGGEIQPFPSPLQECCSSPLQLRELGAKWSVTFSSIGHSQSRSRWNLRFQLNAFPKSRAGRSFRSVSMELYLLCPLSRTSPFTISIYVHEPLNSFKLSRTFCACCCVIFMNIHPDLFRG